MARIGRLSVVISLMLAGLLHSVSPASGAFPGGNGKIVFNRGGELHTVEPDGSSETMLGVEGSHPAWSPDGKRIVFTRLTDPGDGNEGSAVNSVIVADADGRNEVILTHGGNAFDPSWSPDGRTIVFWFTCEGCEPAASILAIDVDGGNARRLTSFPSNHPVWAPDGTEIAFVGVTASGTNTYNDLWLMNPDGSCPKPITAGLPERYRRVQRPEWSPDGQRLSFVLYGDVFSARDVYTIRPDGSGIRQVTSSTEAETDVAWSPDGNSLVFDRGSLGLFIANPDGSEERRVTSGADFDPNWQPVTAGLPSPMEPFELGPISGPLYSLNQELEPPLGGTGGVVQTVACDVVAPLGL